MAAPGPGNGNNGSNNLQRLVVGVGTLFVIVLTVVSALFLTLADLPSGGPTPVAQASPTILLPSPTSPPLPTPLPAATTAIPAFTPVSSPTVPPPTATATQLVAPPTATPIQPTATPIQPPPLPTATPLPPLVVVVTPTPLPAPAVPSPISPSSPGGAVCQSPPGWVSYQVQLGDTLNSLSQRTGTSVYELQQVNCLEIFTLQIGQVIYLPFTPPTPTVTYTPTARTPTPTPTRTGTPTATPRPPEIFSNFPESGVNTEEIIIAVQGRNFQTDDENFRAEFRTGGSRIPLQLGDLRTSTSFEAIVPAGIAAGEYDLWAINPDDQFDVRSSAYVALNP